MPSSEPSGWTAFLILATTVIVLFFAIWAINALCNLVVSAKDALRRRYMEGGVSGLCWYDIAGVPAWLVLEVVCLFAAMLIALLLCWMVYDTARSVRDWWHEGARRR